MSVGIPPFLTLTEKPSALRDKSGALQNPDRLASFQNFIIGIPSRSSHHPLCFVGLHDFGKKHDGYRQFSRKWSLTLIGFNL